MSEFKKVRIEDLKIGPIRHDSLSNEIMEMVDFVFGLIGPHIGNREVFETNLMRDMHPERETAVWVRIALAWRKYRTLYPESPAKHDDALVSMLIGISIGMDYHDFLATAETEISEEAAKKIRAANGFFGDFDYKEWKRQQKKPELSREQFASLLECYKDPTPSGTDLGTWTPLV